MKTIEFGENLVQLSERCIDRRMYFKACQLLIRAGDIFSINNLNYDAATVYDKAGKLLCNGGVEQQELAKTIFYKASLSFVEHGSLNSAANICETIADMNARDDYVNEAIAGYEQCYNYYIIGQSPIKGSLCLVKAI